MRTPIVTASPRIRGGPIAVPLPGNLGAPIRREADAWGQMLIERDERQQRLELLKARREAGRELDELVDGLSADPDWRNSPDAARRQIEQIRERRSQNLPERLREAFLADFDELAHRGFRQVAAGARRMEVDEGRATLLGLVEEGIGRSARLQGEERDRELANLGAAIGTATQAGYFSKVEGQRLWKSAGAGVQKAAADLAADQARVALSADPQAFLADLAAGRFADLDPSRGAELQDAAAARIEAKRRDAEIQAERAERAAEKVLEERRQGYISDLGIKIGRGQASVEEVEEGYRTGLIKPSERTRFVLAIEEGEEKARAQQRAVDRVSLAATGVPLLDHRSAEDRKAVDAHYAATSATWAGGDPAELPAKIAGYVQSVRIMPSAVQGAVRAGLRSADPGAVAQSADLLDRLVTALPQAANDFAKEDIDLGLQVAGLVRAGTAPDQAVRLATEALKAPEAVRQERDQKIRGEDLLGAGRKWLRGELAGADNRLTLRTPEIPPELQAEFDVLYRARYRAHGDDEAARKAAAADLGRVWAFSDADGAGGRWMKYAPEAIYGNGRDPAWMREQLLAEVGRVSAVDPAKGLHGRVRIVADQASAREDRPSYLVMMQDEFGAWNPMPDQRGRPLRWRPDWASSPAGQRERAEIETETAAAKAARARREKQAERKGALLEALRSGNPIGGQ